VPHFFPRHNSDILSRITSQKKSGVAKEKYGGDRGELVQNDSRKARRMVLGGKPRMLVVHEANSV